MRDYCTTNLDLAATLVAFHYPVTQIYDRGRLAEICFARSEELNETLTKYWNGTLLIHPSPLFEAKKKLRARIYDSLTNN